MTFEESQEYLANLRPVFIKNLLAPKVRQSPSEEITYSYDQGSREPPGSDPIVALRFVDKTLHEILISEESCHFLTNL